jgi:hypothetical protein
MRRALVKRIGADHHCLVASASEVLFIAIRSLLLATRAGCLRRMTVKWQLDEGFVASRGATQSDDGAA